MSKSVTRRHKQIQSEYWENSSIWLSHSLPAAVYLFETTRRVASKPQQCLLTWLVTAFRWLRWAERHRSSPSDDDQIIIVLLSRGSTTDLLELFCCLASLVFVCSRVCVVERHIIYWVDVVSIIANTAAVFHRNIKICISFKTTFGYVQSVKAIIVPHNLLG